MRTALAALLLGLSATSLSAEGVGYGPRPGFLIDRMPEGALRDRLAACLGQEARPSLFSIGHRGASLMFPEHTRDSYIAAARMGAGIIECDVTFTKDKELVCRHAQNDLHTTTDILLTPLAATCIKPFTPAAGETKAGAECRTAEITLEEFRSLKPKMDAADAAATTVEAYVAGSTPWRTDLYAQDGTMMTHAESIALIKALGGKFTPELKDPVVEMPFDGFTLEDYALKMLADYTAAGVPPSDVWPQSFNLDVIRIWLEKAPEFAAQAVYLDDRYEAWDEDELKIDPNDPATFKPTMAELKAMGVNYIAPPLWMLVTVEDGRIVPSAYAREAKAAGLSIITWTLERSGPLHSGGGGFYFQSVKDAIRNDGDTYVLLDVLAREVGVVGVFSDWPATVTFYANCMGL